MEQASQAKARARESAPQAQQRTGMDLSRAVMDLTKEIKALHEAIKKYGGMAGGQGGGMIGGAAGGASRGIFGGIGGGAFAGGGALGIGLAGMTWAAQHISSIGRQRIDFMGAQKESAGLGGVRAGSYNYMSGQEMSEALKQRQLMSGRVMRSGGKLNELETESFYKFGSQKESDDYANKIYKQSQDYAKNERTRLDKMPRTNTAEVMNYFQSVF